jgi:hypothetical protein
MGLLKLPEEIQRVLLGLDDQRSIRFFSERRLRPLLMIPKPAKQVREFNRMLGRIQASPSVPSKTDDHTISKFLLPHTHKYAIFCV